MEATTGKPLDGVDLIPYLRGEKTGVPHEKLFWRKDKMAAMRHGDYKLVRLEGYGYRMYNLATDISESVDLRASEPEQFSSMKASLISWDREQVLPWWYEGEAWNSVTYEIHRALMDNDAPRYMNPTQKEAYLNKVN
jgi:arylsulfatase A-like enzyme